MRVISMMIYKYYNDYENKNKNINKNKYNKNA